MNSEPSLDKTSIENPRDLAARASSLYVEDETLPPRRDLNYHVVRIILSLGVAATFSLVLTAVLSCLPSFSTAFVLLTRESLRRYPLSLASLLIVGIRSRC